jgi:hypothetical protein
MPKSSKGQSPWNLHVKKTMAENKGTPLGEVLKMASRTYKRSNPSVGSARTKRRPARTMRRKKTKKRKSSKSKKRKSKNWF